MVDAVYGRYGHGSTFGNVLRPTAPEREPYDAVELEPEALVAALPLGHVPARQTALSLRDLADESFVLYPRANGTLLYDAIIAACQQAGFSPRIVSRRRRSWRQC